MSYCRWGSDSDVYVYSSGSLLHCCGCQLMKEFETHSRAAMIEHLEQHVQAGDKVPSCAFDRLRKEAQVVEK